MVPSTMNRFNVNFPIKLLDWIKKESFKRKISMAELIRQAVVYFKDKSN